MNRIVQSPQQLQPSAHERHHSQLQQLFCNELQELIVKARGMVNDRILRLPEVKSKIGRASATVWKDVSEGVFPPPFSTGARAVGWLESEINAWIEVRVFNARNPSQAIDVKVFVSLLTAPKTKGALK
jgi:prophage regulatory protein